MVFQWCLSFILLVVCASSIPVVQEKEDFLYTIRNSASGMVLDAEDPQQIKVQYYTGYKSQLYKFLRGRKPGLFYIVNNQTGDGLDYIKEEGKYQLVLSQISDTLHKQWYLNSDGRIVNAQNQHVVDALVNNYQHFPGNRVGLYRYTKSRAQEFVLQRKGGDYQKNSSEENNEDWSGESNTDMKKRSMYH